MIARSTLALTAALVLGACASTGATYRSGVGDALLERPPYAAGMSQAEVAARAPRIGHLPVVYQRGGSQDPMFDPALDSTTQTLLRDMTSYLDSLGGTVRMAATTPAGTPPDVSFDCAVPSEPLEDDCPAPEGARGRTPQPMRLAVGRPSPEWIEWAAGSMRDASVDAVLLLTLEVGRYPIRQTGLLGNKEVVLGSGHVERLPWLTSLDQSIMVVQITGAVVGRDGKALRIGAHGVLPRRTPLLASAVGLQRLISPADIAALAKDPVAWQKALSSLTAELLARR